MAEFHTEKTVLISASEDELVTSVAGRLLNRLARRSRAGKTTHVALTGGGVGTSVLRAAGADPLRTEVDWSLVHFWWGDERFVPADSDDRHEVGARRALLDHIDVPAENVHPIPAADGTITIDEAAARYADELARFATETHPWPKFYVCFLGVGSDGHIASLFPDRYEILQTERPVLPVRESPKPPTERITLSRPVLNSARCMWLVVSGPDKASALGLALAGAAYASVPAAGAKGTKRTVFFVDEAAAEHVPLDLIDQDF